MWPMARSSVYGRFKEQKKKTSTAIMISRIVTLSLCDSVTIAACTKEIAAFSEVAANSNGNNLPIIKGLKSKTYFAQYKLSTMHRIMWLILILPDS